MQWLFAVATLVLSALFCVPALAQQCAPPAVVVEKIATSHPVEKMVVLDPDQAARVVSWFNSEPPESEYDFNFAVVLKHVGRQLGLLLGKDGLVCLAALLPDEAVPALLAAIMGTHAMLPLMLVQETPAIHHHEGMSEVVDRFYSTWMRPDHPQQSCCNTVDCYPTEARMRSGHWEALQRETGHWITVPEGSIERNRDAPDARAHLCASGGVDPIVYCFISGGGF